MRSRTIWVVVLAFGLIAAACGGGGSSGGGGGGGKESGGEGGTMKIGADTANNHGTESVAGKSESSVELDDFYFEPTVITGQPGQQVKLELENEGDTTHNFSIDDQNIDQDLASGKDAEVTVTLPQSGIVEFYCKFHRTQGMAGELKAS
jgi:plastocyanin